MLRKLADLSCSGTVTRLMEINEVWYYATLKSHTTPGAKVTLHIERPRQQYRESALRGKRSSAMHCRGMSVGIPGRSHIALLVPQAAVS